MKASHFSATGYVRIFLCLLFSASTFAPASLAAQSKAPGIGQNFYKHLQGIIGDKYAIVMDIVCANSVIEGSYYYAKVGAPIYLYGNMDKNGSFVMNETVDTSTNAVFKGQFVSDSIMQGTWKLLSGASPALKFSLKESYPAGTLRFKAEALHQEHKSKTNKDAGAIFDAFQLQAVAGSGRKSLDTINAAISQSPEDASPDMPAAALLKAAAEEYFEGYEEDMAGLDQNDRNVMYEYNSRSMVVYNAKNVLSLRLRTYDYTGGAHGISGSEGLVFNSKTGRTYDLDDLFKEDYEDALAKAIVKNLRQAYHVPAGKSLESAGFFNNNIDIAEGFLLTSGGIIFIYNPDEIAPHVFGEINIFVPYGDIRPIMQPGVLPF